MLLGCFEQRDQQRKNALLFNRLIYHFSRPHRLTDGHDLDKNVNLWERARCSKRTGYVQM